MSKNYGPKAFEKEWKKRLYNFKETKIFFKKDGPTTIVQYINGDELIGVKMYRCEFEIDNWIDHFQDYLNTGMFDINAYWITYTSTHTDPDDVMSKLVSVYSTKMLQVPMILIKKIWSIHSPEMNAVMKKMRKEQGDLGFKQVNKWYKDTEQHLEIL